MKPTGKQKRAMARIKNRINRAAVEAQTRPTPAAREAAVEDGLKASTAAVNLMAGVKK